MASDTNALFADNTEFLAALRGLIEAWCDRRCLGTLSTILPGYLGLNGLTDGWAGLYDALRNVRAFSRDNLPQQEMEMVDRLIRAAERVVYR
jgi:hypothetical protein